MNDRTRDALDLLERSADMIADLNGDALKTPMRLEQEIRRFVAQAMPTPPDDRPLVPPAPHETCPPLTLMGEHVHSWWAVMVADTDELIKDCACGVRGIFHRDQFGVEQLDHYVTSGTSRENAVFQSAQYQSPYIHT